MGPDAADRLTPLRPDGGPAGARGDRPADSGDDGPTGSGPAGPADDGPRASNGGTAGDRREVTVPLRVFKTVTVVSTLLALATVVSGFVLLDAATDRGQAPPSEVDVPVALAGLGAIALGAVLYAYGTRFRAPVGDEDGGDGSEDGG